MKTIDDITPEDTDRLGFAVSALGAALSDREPADELKEYWQEVKESYDELANLMEGALIGDTD